MGIKETLDKLKEMGAEPEEIGKGYYIVSLERGVGYLIGKPEISEGNYMVPKDILLKAQEKSGAIFGKGLKLVVT